MKLSQSTPNEIQSIKHSTADTTISCSRADEFMPKTISFILVCVCVGNYYTTAAADAVTPAPAPATAQVHGLLLYGPCMYTMYYISLILSFHRFNVFFFLLYVWSFG